MDKINLNDKTLLKSPILHIYFIPKSPIFTNIAFSKNGTAVSIASFLRLRLEDDGEYVGNEKLNYFAS